MAPESPETGPAACQAPLTCLVALQRQQSGKLGGAEAPQAGRIWNPSK